MSLDFQIRFLGDGGNRVRWRAADLERIAKHCGCTTREVALPAQRDMGLPVTDFAVTRSAGAQDYTFTISTESVDRMSDTIALKGWRLDEYRRNPVVLANHASRMLPIGRATRTWIDGTRLRSTVRLSNDRFAQRVGQMLDEGVLRAASVGFQPGEWSFSTDKARPFGIDFKSGHELLEWSIVSVPANADCLVDGAGAAKSATPRLDELRTRLQARQRAMAIEERRR